MKLERIDFQATDGVPLNGLLHLPENKTNTVVIALHGMSSNCFKYREQVIAKKMTQKDVAFFGFNNRGSELMKYLKREKQDGETEHLLGGTSFEDVLESYHDVKGAMIQMLHLGYTNIYLQGHSLGATKVLYTYTKLKEKQETDLLSHIKGIILLSLVDIPNMLVLGLGDKKYKVMLEHAKNLIANGKETDFMPQDAFIHPISAKAFLRYSKENSQIDFARYSETDYNFPELNAVECPLFMRWGDTGELISQPAEDLINTLKHKLQNKKQDIAYIPGADHSYSEKEERLAEEIWDFIQVIISADNGKLIIEKAKEHKRKNIKELFKDYKEDYEPVEMDGGKPEGKEIW